MISVVARGGFVATLRNAAFRIRFVRERSPQILMIPRRTPIATASVRSFAPTFSLMRLRCTLTVSSAMHNWSPISRFRFPAATRSRTSTSRADNVSLPMCSASLAANSARTTFWPECTLRISCSKSLGYVFLSKYPLAPAFSV